jgi:hypothetical protein
MLIEVTTETVLIIEAYKQSWDKVYNSYINWRLAQENGQNIDEAYITLIAESKMMETYGDMLLKSII